jgi:DNA-binding SARP family transcriptional activator
MLASHPNTFVSIDHLVDEVWEYDPPTSAIANIRTYVSNLRRILGQAASRVTGQRTGYRLDLEPVELDLSQFERLVSDGRAALANGDPAESALSLRRALTLFPGPALVGVRPGGALTGMAGMLAEQRLCAVDDLYSAELALGHHADLVSTLRRHVRAHPLRERCWGHLMVALYRCDDPAGALAAFAQARAVLTTELGIEPGAYLRSLQQAVLRRSPELDLPGGRVRSKAPVRATPPARPVPYELPRATPWLVGRARQLDQIRQAFDVAEQMPPVVIVHGPPGSGTSTLAIHAAHEVAYRYPDGLLYLDMREGTREMPAGDAASRLLATLEPDAVPQRALERLRSALTGRKTLIVLDNVATKAQVEQLLPSSAGTAVLIAGDRMLPSLDARHVGLGRFAPSESCELLRAVVGADRVDAEPASVSALTAACGHLPVAVRIAAAQLAARPEWRVRDLAQRLADERTRIDELDIDGLSVRDCLRRGLDRLVRAGGDQAGRLLTALGRQLRETVAPPEVAGWLNSSTRDAEGVLAQLVDSGFVEVVTPGRYALPPLMRSFAQQVALPEWVRAAQARSL